MTIKKYLKSVRDHLKAKLIIKLLLICLKSTMNRKVKPLRDHNLLPLTRSIFKNNFILMKIITTLILLFLFHDALFGQNIWELNKLYNPPKYRIEKKDTVTSIYYEGLPYKGKSKEVFAYYSTPAMISGREKKEEKLPAAVLIHGGGGTAYKEWVSIWARKGYTAIAIDWRGNGPDGKHLPNGGPEHTPETIALNNENEIKNTWVYQAVSDIILAHSLIRSFKEVDSLKTIITGISWGGYLTSIVAGIDNRFKAAIPVYGCGFIYKEHVWDAELITPASLKQKWIQYFDPSSYLAQATMPVLFINGTNDPYYTLNIWMDSYKLVKNKTLCLKVRMPHGHIEGWQSKEIYVFADSYVKGGKPLLKISHFKLKKNSALVTVKAQSLIKAAYLNYTISSNPNWTERKWETVPAKIKGKKVIVPFISENVKVLYISVQDENDLLVSSEVKVRV